MKHDPAYEPPEFWVLKNTGSFSFEFMGGGIGVICGVGCEELDSVLGDRSCVGMVGGTIYVRGPVGAFPTMSGCSISTRPTAHFWREGLPVFLGKIERPQLLAELSDFSQWRKIVAKTYEERKRPPPHHHARVPHSASGWRGGSSATWSRTTTPMSPAWSTPATTG